MATSKYTQREIDKLCAVGEKALAILAYEDNGTPSGVMNMRATLQQVGMASFMRVMPTGYTESLQYLIRQYSIREIK